MMPTPQDVFYFSPFQDSTGFTSSKGFKDKKGDRRAPIFLFDRKTPFALYSWLIDINTPCEQRPFPRRKISNRDHQSTIGNE
jgi:hypothetical protein